MSSTNKVEVVVVGAGPAGLACAATLAQKGVEVMVLERGAYPGAKNMFGGIFFSPIIEKIFPEFISEAPWERFVAKRRFSLLSGDSETALGVQNSRFATPPYNHSFIVRRAAMDQWFAKKVEAAGASLICEYCVKDFLWEGKKIVGITSGSEENSLRAEVVVCAEGANSLLAEKSGLRQKILPKARSIAVKENIRLPREVIEDRFGLSGKEGAAYEFFGAAVDGMLGSGFVYTNAESLSVGIGFSIEDFVQRGETRTPHDFLEQFKSHPAIAPLLRGGETVEYLTHMIPCDAFDRLPQVCGDGILLVGDAAGLVNNSFLHEGVNLAMASGVFAAEAILDARAQKNFSATALQGYAAKLKKSFVGQDLKEYRNFISHVSANPRLLNEYPGLVNEILADYFSVSEKSKNVIKKEILAKVRSRLGFTKMAGDLWGAVKNLF